MINILDKSNCCGCGACVSICPKQCIYMNSDNEGFFYPSVNKDICIDCGLCEKVCNELHPFSSREPLEVLAAINKNDNIRFKSSSGGIFYILAEKIINEGGIVFGARFDKNFQVVIDYTDNMEGVEAFMGSKYVQSSIGTAYKDAKHFLISGKKVLFSGTPCQIAGLHKFLGKKYTNLLSVDLICHGVPSPKVWDLYIKSILKKNKTITDISFRDKSNSWRNSFFTINYKESEKSKTLKTLSSNSLYMRAFLSDLILRPSCYSCKVKSCSSQSDITLADFWGIWNICPEMHDDKGTSMLFVNTDKGLEVLPSNKEVRYLKANYTDAKLYNKACISSAVPHIKRSEFFESLEDGENIKELMKNILPSRSIINRVKNKCKLFINKYFS